MTTHQMIAVLCSVIVSRPCDGWSVPQMFGGRSLRSVLPPRETTALVDHLIQGNSRLSKDVSVIMVAENECGVQIANLPRRRNTSLSDSSATELVFVDRSEFVTARCGLETIVGGALASYFRLHKDIAHEHEELLPSFYIAIFLCLTNQNKIDGGPFDAYLNTLPTLEELQHLPVFWSDNILDELQNSVVKTAVQYRRRDWEKEYWIILDAISEAAGSPKHDFVDLDIWKWARSIIASRSFTDYIRGEPCLIPYIDMLNHISPGQANSRLDVIKCDWNIDESGFCLKLPPSNQNDIFQEDSKKILEISYGSHSNSNFLMNYGFSVDDAYQCVENKVTLSISLVHDSAKDVERMWEADGLGHQVSRNVTVNIGNPGPFQSLLSLCRVASCQGDELTCMRDTFLTLGETTTQDTLNGLVPQMGATLCRSPLSLFNEVRAMEMLQQTAMEAMLRYKTRLAQDEVLLHEHDGLSWRRRWFGTKKDNNKVVHALIVRRGEKLVLQHVYNLATLSLVFLSMENIDFETYKGMLAATLEADEALQI